MSIIKKDEKAEWREKAIKDENVIFRIGKKRHVLTRYDLAFVTGHSVDNRDRSPKQKTLLYNSQKCTPYKITKKYKNKETLIR